MDTYNAIHNALDSVGQCGGTPICDSLAWANKYLEDQKMPAGDTYVLLATDGAPNCNDSLDISTCEATQMDDQGNPVAPKSPLQCLDDKCAYNQAQGLALAGYKMFVIGVGEDVDAFAGVMNGLAYFGQVDTPPLNTDIPEDKTFYFPAADAPALNSSLEKITNQVIDCQYDVAWSTVPDVNADGTAVEKRCDSVNLTGTKTGGGSVVISYSGVEKGVPDNCDNETAKALGWYWLEQKGKSFEDVTDLGEDLSQCRKIQLCPMACEKLKADEGIREWSSINASFGCESTTIPIID